MNPHPLDSSYLTMAVPVTGSVMGHLHMGQVVSEMARTLTIEQMDYIIMRLQESKEARLASKQLPIWK